MPFSGKSEAEGVEIELIRSLYEAFGSSVIMSAGFALCGALIAVETRDRIILFALLGGIVTSVIRLAESWRSSKVAMLGDLRIDQARVLERRFAITYYAFAAMLGVFGARAFMLGAPEMHMVVTCLLVGYGAGVAAGIGLRPRIAARSMVVAIAPAAISASAWGVPFYIATALMMAGLLVGGIRSLRGRRDRAAREIGRRIIFATLARRDALTALPNRLALREWFDDRFSSTDAKVLIGIHCLDLNGFKSVNDEFGHPVGDKLLVAVASRLARSIRGGDIVARLGGDEFAIVQSDIVHAGEAESLAHRVIMEIARPFELGEHVIQISACNGYVVSSDLTDNLEHLLNLADQALYESKRSGEDVTRHEWIVALARHRS